MTMQLDWPAIHDDAVRLLQTSPSIPRLPLDGLDKSQHVLQRHIPLDVVRRSKDVPALAPEVQ